MSANYEFFSPTTFVCTAVIGILSVFSYRIKMSGKWKCENAGTCGNMFEAKMEAVRRTESVDYLAAIGYCSDGFHCRGKRNKRTRMKCWKCTFQFHSPKAKFSDRGRCEIFKIRHRESTFGKHKNLQ